MTDAVVTTYTYILSVIVVELTYFLPKVKSWTGRKPRLSSLYFNLSPRHQRILLPKTSKDEGPPPFKSVPVLYRLAVRADFRRLYPANAKTPTCCPSGNNRTKVTNSVTSARSLWWHVGPYFWPADLTRTENPIVGHCIICMVICLRALRTHAFNDSHASNAWAGPG